MQSQLFDALNKNIKNRKDLGISALGCGTFGLIWSVLRWATVDIYWPALFGGALFLGLKIIFWETSDSPDAASPRQAEESKT